MGSGSYQRDVTMALAEIKKQLYRMNLYLSGKENEMKEHSTTAPPSTSETVSLGGQHTICNQGWQCPVCKRVYSPFTSMCFYCGRTDLSNIEITYKTTTTSK